MKFKLNKIALALPLGIMALGATAGQYPDDIPTFELTPVQQNAQYKSNKAHFEGRYFVLLKDEPVALYQGGIEGFKATNVTASKGVNVTNTGKLNLASSASVVYGNYLALQQNKAIDNIRKTLGRDVQLQDSFKIALNGLVVDLEEHEVLALRKMPGVLAVEKEEMQQLLTDVGPQHVGAPAIWDNPDIEGAKGEGLVIGVMDTGIASYQKKVYSWSGAAGFDNVPFTPSFADIGGDGYDHNNPNGEGVYFGDCVDSPYWCNDKLIGVVSYRGFRSVAGMSSSDMRFDTGQDTHGHGTHVSSTIAGNVVHDVKYPTVYPHMEQSYKHQYYDSEMTVSMSGVAPHANIVSYQTCNVYGCAPSAAVASIEHAIANNVDVLNYSVGGGASSPWFTADALAFLSAREAGIHTAVAAGNSGRNGEKTVGSPGNSPWVTTVAALTHSRDFTEEKTATFSGGATELADLIGKGATSGVGLDTPLDVVYAGDVEASSGAETAGGVGYCGKYSLPAYYTAESVEGKVVICRRGGVDADGEPLSRLSKGAEALRTRAAGMIFINSDEEYDNVANDLHVLPTVHLNKADGETLLAWLGEGEGHKVSFTDSELVLNEDKADITAPFTSRGPDYFTGDYLIPDIGAPGVAILAAGLGNRMHSSANPVYAQINGDARFMDGTSMATPHIAGMYLLMKAAQPDWTPAEAQSALMTTAFTAVTEDDDYDGVKNRADMHRTGSGSARVNLAIEAGLVLNETRAGYLAANPYAEQFGMVDSIEGWHGQPHQMNMPSLSKGECLIDCSWTRTFKATKDGSWNVSFEYYNEGFNVTADQETISLAAGEEAVINFTAEALQGLADEWVNGRVVLTPTDNSMPVQTMPITVNFIAGIAPDITEVTAKRTNDSAPVKGIVTIGTDELQLSKSGIAKADVYEIELMRDATNNQIWHWQEEDNKTIYAIPLNVQADTKRLVVDVMETTSPDVDIYVGIDADLDGTVSTAIEMGLIRYMSAQADSDELIDIVDPIQDTYWVLVHNWAEGPAELEEHQMVCAEGEEADEGMECAEAPIMDSVKFSVTNVTYDDESMSVSVPTAVAPREEVVTRVQWDQPMMQDDIYHGVFWLGTTPELNQNIGAVRVNMVRGEDDVTISEPTINGDKIVVTLRVSANNSGENRDYDFQMMLSEGVNVDILLKDDVVEGASMQMNADEFTYAVENNNLTWQHTQVDGANALEFNLVLDASEVLGLIDATPVVTAGVNTSSAMETKSSEPVFYAGRPSFSVNSSVDTVKEGKPVTLSASVVDAVIDNPEISYQWTQVSGPAVSLIGAGASVSFDAPKVSHDEVVTFEMIGSNGDKASFAETVSVNVENKSSGGTTGLGFIILAGLGLFSRRRK
ncbi:S8 family serine peptidase [Thalassotalea nanhaiensis]|uniref:S8 family serine peptidase n=1 Tax=Thalassotalea nanhaiensis TaxID=3065648 RepID=A0ABY9TFT0_9GAMM|nr:S8 family serine peptidase [Colwelliaceae bacterium SQ345]